MAKAAVVGLAGVECIIVLAALLAEFDGRVLIANEVQVEREESCDDQGQHTRQDVGCHDEVGEFVVEALWV